MTSDNLEDEYPHWKDALFGDHNAVANIRCAIHYVFWHAVYLLIAAVGMLTVALLLGVKQLARFAGPLSAPIVSAIDRAVLAVSAVAQHRYTKKLVDGILLALFFAAIGTVLVTFGWALYTQFWTTLIVMGGAVLGIIGAFVALVASAYLYDYASTVALTAATTARGAGERAVETPGIRRVYGKCPVSLNQSPKWFDSIFPEDEV